MSRNTITSNDLIGLRVVGGKSGEKLIGKVRHLVFHPKERRVIGFIVKRPDLALMFHRKDLFVALDSYEIVDGRVCVSTESGATDKAACKRLGVDWDSCVLWSGMSIVTESGTTVGTIGTVTFDRLTGRVESVVADRGATSKALLGTVEIPVGQIRGFRFGIGELVSEMESQGEVVEEENELRGAILVADSVLQIEAEGGLAEMAGHAVGKAKPVVRETAQKAGEAANKGVEALGKRVGETKGAFAGFKEEYQKAVKDDEPTALPASEGSAEVKASQTSDAKPVTKPAATAQKPSADATVAKAVGKQLRKSKGMFAAFKEEYDKASK